MEKEIELERENIVLTTGGAVKSVNGQTGDVVLTTSDLENTSDYQTGDEVDTAIANAIGEIDIPDKTSDLTNDGSDGTSTYVEADELAAVATTGAYSDLSGTPTIPDKTSDLTNDGSDGTSTYVEADELATVATTGSYSDLNNKPSIPTKTSDLTNDGANGTSTYVEATALADETAARQNADNGLQGQIDALSAASDVTDIVGTKAELNSYDTSKLKDNDIIKVLQDESQNNETTYYRWSTSTQTFTLIGEEGPYYTKAATDVLLQGKQDLLTPGANITIEEESGTGDLVISASSTAYTAGDGIDISAQDIISATNTGKAKVLTTADYNWNYTTKTTENPNCVALWLLEPGIYTKNYTYNTPPVVYVTSTTAGAPADYGYIVFNTKDNSYRQIARLNWDQNSVTGGNKTYFYTYSVDTTAGSGTEGGIFVSNKQIADNLTTTNRAWVLAANQGKVLKDLIDSLITKAAGAPTTSTAGTIGKLYEDTTNGDLYICTNAASPYAWEKVNDRDDYIIKDAGAPTTATVGTVGKLYEDTTNGKLYICTAVDTTTDPSNPTYTWAEVGGSSINVVQTTGTSATDVMSQNAVTSMVYADPGTRRRISISHTGSSGASYPSIKIGNSNNTTDARGIAIGGDTGTTYRVRAGMDAIGIGSSSADATGERSIAIGEGAKATQLFSTTLGCYGRSEYQGGVAIGGYSVVSQVGEVSIGNLTNTTAYALSKTYNNSGYRLLTGLYDPQSAHDAATKGYVDANAATLLTNTQFNAILEEA